MEVQQSLPGVYRELADYYEQRADPSMRDRFLVLAMDAALRTNRTDEVERCRRRLLQVNPHHLLRPFASFAEAIRSPDVQTYLRDLRMNYPSEVAQVLLRSLRGNPSRARTEPAAPLLAARHLDLAETPRPERLVELPPPVAPRGRTLSYGTPPRRPGWFGPLLFVILLVASLGLGTFVALRPFVPGMVDAVRLP